MECIDFSQGGNFEAVEGGHPIVSEKLYALLQLYKSQSLKFLKTEWGGGIFSYTVQPHPVHPLMSSVIFKENKKI